MQPNKRCGLVGPGGASAELRPALGLRWSVYHTSFHQTERRLEGRLERRQAYSVGRGSREPESGRQAALQRFGAYRVRGRTWRKRSPDPPETSGIEGGAGRATYTPTCSSMHLVTRARLPARRGNDGAAPVKGIVGRKRRWRNSVW